MIYKGEPVMKYLHPEGCDYISLPFYTGDRGVCKCAPLWGHNAETWERYQRSASPAPVCLGIFTTACGCTQKLTISFPPLSYYRLPLKTKKVSSSFGPLTVNYGSRGFELKDYVKETKTAFYEEK
jgi:hypothetical protein